MHFIKYSWNSILTFSMIIKALENYQEKKFYIEYILIKFNSQLSTLQFEFIKFKSETISHSMMCFTCIRAQVDWKYFKNALQVKINYISLYLLEVHCGRSVTVVRFLAAFVLCNVSSVFCKCLNIFVYVMCIDVKYKR